MRYPSVDALQKALAQDVFHNRQDIKKAAGRALGTIVELIVFYVLREWGLLKYLSIERGLGEFGNDAIKHNVEFGLHPNRSSLEREFELVSSSSSLSAKKIIDQLNLKTGSRKPNCLLDGNGILRNSCLIANVDDELIMANLLSKNGRNCRLQINQLRNEPFAMVECKRVGVEDGARKGPTTIEKAKQGAYVAKHVSSFQKIRGHDGKMYGVMPKPDGKFEIAAWEEELDRLIYNSNVSELHGFILTVGVVSNHGNWFTSDDPNKELLVLKQSYDWLTFLNDGGIVKFVTDTILSKSDAMQPVREAFSCSYTSKTQGGNQFTKVKISLAAHERLCEYFSDHIDEIQNEWFSVLSPKRRTLTELRKELHTLGEKPWP